MRTHTAGCEPTPSSSECATSLNPGPRLSLGLCGGRCPQPAAHVFLWRQSWTSVAEGRGQHQLGRVAGPRLCVRMLFTAHGCAGAGGRGSGPPSSLAAQGCLQRQGPLPGAGSQVVRIEPIGTDIGMLCSLQVWGHGGPGPHLPSASQLLWPSESPKRKWGQGCGRALGLWRNSVLEPQTDGCLDLPGTTVVVKGPDAASSHT